jgi:pathogenesis-related protein 1
MRAPRLTPVLLAAALAACGSSPAVTRTPGPSPFPLDPNVDYGAGEPAGLASITAAHNAVRAPLGIAPLTWDPSLAATAAAWAAQCQSTGGLLLDHNPSRHQGTPQYFGENIYASTAGLDQVTGPQAVTAWAAEAAYYDYASNSCASGQVCGHYTQVVWAATTRVGCAKVSCAGLTYPTNIVCDYAPGGNYVGQKPY